MQHQREGIDDLTCRARTLGASAAVIIPACTLVVVDHFATLCGAPHRCPSYGLAPGCPPHALKPDVFRNQLRQYQHVLVFKIDAPVTALMGSERLNIARTIHYIAATLEREAIDRECLQARGLAAGSCKELFCPEQKACVVLAQRLPCPHAALARPSLSALGVDFALLAESVGWRFEKLDKKAAATGEPAMGLMAGMVLLA